jgi:hydroxylamine reductase (hybrid-cluster protein)
LTWLEEHESQKKSQLEEELKNLNQSNESANSNTRSSGEPSWFTAAKMNVANTQKINQIKQELAKITLKEDKIRKLHERAKVIKKKLTTDRKKSETKVDFSKKGKEVQENKDPDDQFLIDDPTTDSDSEIEEEVEEMVMCLYLT